MIPSILCWQQHFGLVWICIFLFLKISLGGNELILFFNKRPIYLDSVDIYRFEKDRQVTVIFIHKILKAM